ncbi:MAG: hypothetical protein WA051_02065 [Minisyncoccia bacterium]
MSFNGLQRNIQPKMSFKNMMQSGPVFWLTVILIVSLGRGAILTFMKERETDKLAKDAQNKLSELSNREVELNEKIDYLKTPEGTETELRSIYNAAKPGESVVLIIDGKPATNTEIKEKTFWSKIVSFFTRN